MADLDCALSIRFAIDENLPYLEFKNLIDRIK